MAGFNDARGRDGGVTGDDDDDRMRPGRQRVILVPGFTVHDAAPPIAGRRSLRTSIAESVRLVRQRRIAINRHGSNPTETFPTAILA